jgi:hypothetical protein|tara:strand:+ start:260 stop:472 length:213 start_codon:yes stop_codon:yes gene_type:complete
MSNKPRPIIEKDKNGNLVYLAIWKEVDDPDGGTTVVVTKAHIQAYWSKNDLCWIYADQQKVMESVVGIFD